jgi:hypothetical protein
MKGMSACWVIRDWDGLLRKAADLYDKKTGRGLETWTTEPTLLTFTGRSFSAQKHKNGKYGPIEKFGGMLLETIHFPDSPNQDRFPSTVLRPGEKYHSETEYRFYIKREVRGFYVSANIGMQAFDMTRPYLFQNGKFISFEKGFGRGFGVMTGIGIGYSHTFKERWVVDAFFAFDRMWSWYNDYFENGEINLFPRHMYDTKYPDPFNGSAEWLPSKIGVSIGYKIFDPKKHSDF